MLPRRYLIYLLFIFQAVQKRPEIPHSKPPHLNRTILGEITETLVGNKAQYL